MQRTVLAAIAYSIFCGACGAVQFAPVEGQRPMPTRTQNIPDCAQLAVEHPAAAYPRDEMRRGVEGWAVLSYKLTGDGTASDLRVVDSEPKDVFVPAAAKHLQTWRFREGVVQDACMHIVGFRVR